MTGVNKYIVILGFCLLGSIACAANIDIEKVTGVVGGNKLPIGTCLKVYIKLTNDFPVNITSLSNGFTVDSPDGAVWYPHAFVDTGVSFTRDLVFDTTFYVTWTDSSTEYGDNWTNYFELYNALTYWEPVLGAVVDTAAFWAIKQTGSGLAPGTSVVPWLLQIDSVASSSIGRTICIDSSAVRDVPWGWFNGGNTYVPTWDGPYCFEIVADCCEGIRGNINLDLQDTIDISDLTALVGWMFKSGSAPPCMLEADVDGNGEHDIADVTYLVAYMFKSGPEPAACP